MDLKKPKELSILALVLALATGGGGYASFEAVLKIGDTRWVSVVSYKQGLVWEVQDALGIIQKRINNGTATPDDLTRKEVLEERLKYLLKED